MRGLALTVLLGVLVVGAGAVGAADWGGVIPGESTKEIVRARHGDPTRATTQKVDRFDSAQWVYEGDQAPTGMFRMTVDFGLAGPAGFRADVVRSFKLEPHPGIFTRPAIVDGWGRPSGAAPAGQPPAFFYESGLLVYFDKDGWEVQAMVFTLPQTNGGQAAPQR
ncbi:MAG: hypothetical protein DMD89_11360 [Candidatus Rokuibacteriota bacterium]|nr:MAG: hypothetical protein DMD89_11360 [Candidatus Rokubacteria bacterium]